MRAKKSYADQIQEALQQAGGTAKLADLYRLLAGNFKSWKTRTPEASVRCTLLRDARFKSSRPGVWSLAEMPTLEQAEIQWTQEPKVEEPDWIPDQESASRQQFQPYVVPFVPALEGDYRQRFYSLVESWRLQDGDDHVQTIEKELRSIAANRQTEELHRYRAILLLLRDLLATTWEANFQYGRLMLSTHGVAETQTSGHGTTTDSKDMLRHFMESSRMRVIETNADFIRAVEAGTWYHQTRPISALVTDGAELAAALKTVTVGKQSLSEVVDPEIEMVDDKTDEWTGLRLMDIWRYFRYTWSSPAENTPGRSCQFLIRNKALPGRPVMAIISLDNCALAMGPRDKFIGWTPDAFLDRMAHMGFSALETLHVLDGYIEDGIQGINTRGLWLTKQRLAHPTSEYISRLRRGEQEAKATRKDSLSAAIFRVDSDEATGLLFQKKRAGKLAGLLEARLAMQTAVEKRGNDVTYALLKRLAPSITIALQAQKEKHIGTSMLELNVCGAVRPYNELLAGKLAAMLALSPFVIAQYHKKYRERPSEIASQMKGEAVIRDPWLVYVGTTSLYSVGSSQYNRIKIPREVTDSTFPLIYRELDERTQGFGTFHISRETIGAFGEVLKKIGSQTINHQFGEGASPKLRLLGEAIRNLLVSDKETDLSAFTRHAMPRIVYAAPLIDNLFEYLLGFDEEPGYYATAKDKNSGTQRIIDFWQDRWLKKRITYSPALQKVRNFTKTRRDFGRQVGILLEGRNKMPATETRSDEPMTQPPESTHNKDCSSRRIKFLRHFYRNGSAYADTTSSDDLRSIHVKTRLDDAVLDVIRSGRDCVLTGNPGDGKTHLIKVLEEQIRKINPDVEILYDASTISTEEILRKWDDTRKRKIPFVLAINAAVLDELAQSSNASQIVKDAYRQFQFGVTYTKAERDGISDSDVVVFNLGLRSALTTDVVDGVMNQMSSDDIFKGCGTCALANTCGFIQHARILRSDRFRERIKHVLHRVEVSGHHITVRDVQAFFSYLVFWGRPCEHPQIESEAQKDEFRIESLIYEKGHGALFKAIRETFDPAQISLPTLDEKLVVGDYANEDWAQESQEPHSQIQRFDKDNAAFNRRKRAFYFFHRQGDQLLDTTSAVKRFEDFLGLPEKKQRKMLLQKLRVLLGDHSSRDSDSFPVWHCFRYNQSPRSIIFSTGTIPESQFQVCKPTPLPSMEKGIDIPMNHAVLYVQSSGSHLKIDFVLFSLLEDAEQKVPIWALEESGEAKKVWRFMENLKSPENSQDDIRLSLLDIRHEGTNPLIVKIDQTDNLYCEIIS